MQLLTAISGKLVSVELLSQDHGSPTEVSAIFVHCLAKSELAVANHGRRGVQEALLIFGKLKKLERASGEGVTRQGSAITNMIPPKKCQK